MKARDNARDRNPISSELAIPGESSKLKFIKFNKRNREVGERFIFTSCFTPTEYRTANDRLTELTNNVCRAHDQLKTGRIKLARGRSSDRIYYAGEFTGFAAANYTALHSR